MAKSDIEIAESRKGKFTEWCRRKGYSGATWSCEEEGLASRMEKVRKRARFSRNSRSWVK